MSKGSANEAWHPPAGKAPRVYRNGSNGSVDFVDILKVVCETSKHSHKARPGRTKALTGIRFVRYHARSLFLMSESSSQRPL